MSHLSGDGSDTNVQLPGIIVLRAVNTLLETSSPLCVDALISVHRLLSNRDWNHAAAVNRHWFHAASTSKAWRMVIERKMHCIVSRPKSWQEKEEEERRKQDEEEENASCWNFLCSKKNREEEEEDLQVDPSKLPFNPKQWSLRHLVSTMKIESLSWTDGSFNMYIEVYSGLTSLEIGSLTVESPNDLKYEKERTGIFRIPIQLPLNLTSLIIDRMQFADKTIAQEFVTAVGACTKMKTLILKNEAENISYQHDEKDADFTTWRNLTQLTKLTFLWHRGNDVFIAMQHVGTLTNLTSLTIGDAFLSYSHLIGRENYFTYLKLPKVRTLHLATTEMSRGLITTLSDVMPQLEEFVCTSMHLHYDVKKQKQTEQVDLLLYARFLNLKSLHIPSRPSLGVRIIGQRCDETEVDYMRVICEQMKNLTSIQFTSWIFRDGISWGLLDQTRNSITKLVFHEIKDVDVLFLLGQHASLLLSQLMHLEFVDCTSSIAFSSLMYLKTLKKCETFLITESLVPTKASILFETFDILFLEHLPKLQHLLIKQHPVNTAPMWKEVLIIEWNQQKRVNRCSGQSLPNVTELRRRFRSEYEMDEDGPSVMPPASRLVGIELNPGPSMQPSASTLFFDGLCLIFSHLTDREWLQAAMTSKYWFTAASIKDQHRRFTKQLGDLTIEPSFTARIGAFIQGLATMWKPQPQPQEPQLSRWSLEHHIASLRITTVRLNDLSHHLARYPGITSLHLQCLENSTIALSSSNTPSRDTIVLPSSLRSIIIDFSIWSRPSRRDNRIGTLHHETSSSEHHRQSRSATLQVMLNSIVKYCSQPLSCSIVLSSPDLAPTRLDWSVLAKSSISSFSLRDVCGRGDLNLASSWLSSFDTIQEWRTLQYLTLLLASQEQLSLFLVHLQYDEHIPYPELRRLIILEFFVSGHETLLLAKTMPRLEVLEGLVDLQTAVIQARGDSAKYALPLFPHITSYTHRPLVDYITAPADDALLRDALCSSFGRDSFTHLTFHTRTISSYVLCSQLSDSYSHLTHLSFYNIHQFDLDATIKRAMLSSLNHQIRRLDLRGCRMREVRNLMDDLNVFKSLTHLHVDQCLEQPHPQYGGIDLAPYEQNQIDITARVDEGSAFLPHLISFRWIESGQMNLTWDCGKQTNSIRYFNGQRMIQSQFARPFTLPTSQKDVHDDNLWCRTES